MCNREARTGCGFLNEPSLRFVVLLFSPLVKFDPGLKRITSDYFARIKLAFGPLQQKLLEINRYFVSGKGAACPMMKTRCCHAYRHHFYVHPT